MKTALVCAPLLMIGSAACLPAPSAENLPVLQNAVPANDLVVSNHLVLRGPVSFEQGLSYELNYPRSALSNVLSGTRNIDAATGFDIPIHQTERLNFEHDTFTRHDLANYDLEVSGKINGTGNALAGNLSLLGKHGTDYVSPGASEWSALSGSVTKIRPLGGGYDVDGGPQGWSLYTAYAQNTDLPSSISGADTLSESDMWESNLDDLNTRFGHQTSIYTQSGMQHPSDVGRAEYIACFANCGDEIEIGGAYSVAAIDLHTAATAEPRIISATPEAPVYSVKVDNVMPLSHGGAFAGQYGYVGGNSTAAITGIRALAANGRSLTVSNSRGTFAGQEAAGAYLERGMSVFDLTEPSAVPRHTQIIGATGGFNGNGVVEGVSLELRVRPETS